MKLRIRESVLRENAITDIRQLGVIDKSAKHSLER